MPPKTTNRLVIRDCVKFEWFELMILGRKPTVKYQEILEEIKTEARKEAIRDVVLDQDMQMQAAYQKGCEEGMKAGSKIIQLKQSNKDD